jgi:hypothetical protein
VTCFVVRAGHRRRRISSALARAAVDFARERGARALEAYPMLTEPGKDIIWDEIHVGARSVFAAAGFTQVSHPMRTTITLEPDIAARLRRLATERGTSFKSTVNATLRAGLEAERGSGRPNREVTRPLGAQPGVDLTKALALASAYEDDEILRELEARK